MSEFLVIIQHSSDGILVSRVVNAVPAKGDWVSIGTETYVVKQRIWDYSDARSVRLIVEEPKE